MEKDQRIVLFLIELFEQANDQVVTLQRLLKYIEENHPAVKKQYPIDVDVYGFE